jgi:formylglycine-generating enzyme required for sulfatase activity
MRKPSVALASVATILALDLGGAGLKPCATGIADGAGPTLSATVDAAAQAPAGFREAIAGTLVSFEMVPVPGGTVTIEGRQVEVGPFSIGRTEVTWDLYDVFALGLDTPAGGTADAHARPSEPYGAPDQGWGHAGFPVISVTRDAAEAFAVWLSGKTGRKYRLPTDAEWLRAADLAVGPQGLDGARRDALAWHAGNSGGRAHPVAMKAPDALGLHDIFGNAAEWVTGTPRPMARGGSYRDPAAAVGPGARLMQDAAWNERDPQLPRSRWWLPDAPFVGFRIVADAGG